MTATDKLSKFFSYGEVTYCDKRTGIDNTPTTEHLENLVAVCNNIADKCREFVGGPLHGYFYRCPALNKITPGADPNSQHQIGQAVDLDTDKYGGDNKAMFDFIREKLTYDIMIWEFGTKDRPDWIHVSYRLPKYGVNRKFAKRAYRDEAGKTHYIPFDLY
jgi:hypothetical protein